jgi:hypothetical protein
MTKRFLIIAVCIVLFSQLATAQSKYITRSNISYDASGKRFVYDYDLESGSPCNIQVTVVYKGITITNPTLKGEWGTCIKSGPGKKIIWYCTKDIPDWSGLKDDVRINVRAEVPKSKKGGIIAGIILLGAGSGILVPGYKGYSSALTDYTVYRDNTNPNTALWASQSRSDYYTVTNNKYKTSQYILAAGGSVIVAGAAILISRSVKAKKQGSTDCTLKSPVQIYPSICTSTGMGLGLNMRF